MSITLSIKKLNTPNIAMATAAATTTTTITITTSIIITKLNNNIIGNILNKLLHFFYSLIEICLKTKMW